MSMNFSDSETAKNLMRAFAGESQARNRYTFAASQAKSNELHVIEAVFTFTANQEKEHAEIYYNHLKNLASTTIEIDGGYPVDISSSIEDLLKFATHNEFEEYDPVYKSFGDIAKKEGYENIANSFYNIAKIEKTHGERFERYLNLLRCGELFVSKMSTKWMCLNCGYIFEGTNAPEVCPVCSHNKGFFIRLEMAPYEGCLK